MLTSVPGALLGRISQALDHWAVAIGLVECSFTRTPPFSGTWNTIILSFSLKENSALLCRVLPGWNGLTGANIVGKWLF